MTDLFWILAGWTFVALFGVLLAALNLASRRRTQRKHDAIRMVRYIDEPRRKLENARYYTPSKPHEVQVSNMRRNDDRRRAWSERWEWAVSKSHYHQCMLMLGKYHKCSPELRARLHREAQK